MKSKLTMLNLNNLTEVKNPMENEDLINKDDIDNE